MRILFLAAHLPYPPISGGRRREYELLTRLGKHAAIHLCCVSKTYAEDQRNLPRMQPWCRDITLVPATDPDPSPQTNTAYPYQIRRHIAQSLGRFLTDLLVTHRFDLVHVEGYYLMQHLPAVTPIPILLGEQNVEYLLYQQRALLASTTCERDQCWNEYRRTMAWERQAWRRATRCITVTTDDQRHMLNAEPGLHVEVVPDGADHLPVITEQCDSAGEPGSRDVEPVVLFPGNFAYEPNVDAARHLLSDIFPNIRREIPNVRLLLVGNAPPPLLRTLAEQSQVVLTGRVPSLMPFFEAADIVICPLRIGGGIKVKVLEALRAGKAIVSSSIGVQGLDDVARQAIAIADDPTLFVTHVVHLLRNPAARTRMQTAAWHAGRQLPTWDDAAEALVGCYTRLIQHPSEASR